jgi:hypothetical protein
MQKLTRSDLWSLEQYAEQRPAFRAEVLAHKKPRQVSLGPHATLYFEDRLTIQYQIQEMLRVERVFEAAGINDELDAYNPLIPDGTNWKATFMIEYSDVEERRQALARLAGVEHRVWAQADELDRVFAIANEDMERSTEDKTAAVHFLRFELPQAMITALKDGARLTFGIDYEGFDQRTEVSAASREALAADLD